MHRSILILAIVAVVLGQEVPEIPVSPSAKERHGFKESQSTSSGWRRLAVRTGAVIDQKVRKLVEKGSGLIPVFIVLRHQPHREILERYERGPAQLRLEMLEGRQEQLAEQMPPPVADMAEARRKIERAMLEVRRQAFKEIKARLQPEQDEIAALVSQLGARNVHRYTAINMLAAEVPASAIDTLASHPLVAEIGLVEKQFAQLKYSVPALGAPVFWSAGYTGVGESVAVLDTGVRPVLRR